ncbi:MAG: hypothetical protein M1821_001670 [Bathelium mastoideum]|nr:MAG: hypothetical protein M1821_001670 [Bathelium mastoideum]KAI9691559.1 MAG: hypothetical protein M1822_007630 [Bathelium mastoideum]
MWRDRTNLYISYRQSYNHHLTKKTPGAASNGYGDGGSVPEERRGLMSTGAYEDDGDAVIEMDLLPPRWLDIQDQVTDLLGNIAQQMKRLEQLHQKHVLPGFDDEEVKKREERDIEKLTQEVTRGFQSCQKAIQRIDPMVRDSAQQGSISRGEETMAKNLKISLASRVGEVSALFRKKQSAYLKKLRNLGGMASPLERSSTPVQNPYTDPSLMESDADRSFSQSTLLQTAQKKRHTNVHDSMIAQREREIEDIAQGIIELANIFQELQTMVIDQGSMLDRIDYNVERMATDVKAADKELTVATGYQKRTTKRKIILLLLLLVVALFILLLLKPRRKQAPSPAPDPVPEPDAPPPGRLLTLKSRDWRRRKRRRKLEFGFEVAGLL